MCRACCGELHSPGSDRITPTLWEALAEAGVLGLAIEESLGGSGGALTDLGVFCRGGRTCAVPHDRAQHLQAALAVDWLGGAGRPCGLAARTGVRSIAGHHRAVAPARRGACRLHCAPPPRGTALGGSGVADFVADADSADLIVVAAQTGCAGTGVRHRPATPPGMHRRTTHHDGWVQRRSASPLTMCWSTILADPWRYRRTRRAGPAPRRQCGDRIGVAWIWSGWARRCCSAPSTTPRCGSSSAGRSRLFRLPSIWWPNMHIALSAARLAARSAVFWIGRGHTATPGNRRREDARRDGDQAVTLDAHQLHGGMGYVVDTDLHLFSERARVLSTLGGGADVAATWLDARWIGRGQ